MHPGKYSLLGMGSMFPTVPNEEKLCRVSLPRCSAITEAAAYLFGQSLTSTGRNISKQWGHCLERWCVFTAVFPVPAFPPGLCWQVTGTPDSWGTEQGALLGSLHLSHVFLSSSTLQYSQEAPQTEEQPAHAQLCAGHQVSSHHILVVTLLWLRSP